MIEVGQLLHDAEVVDIQDWQDTLSQDWLHIALSSKPPESSLLGYLLPASYPFREGTTAEIAIKSMLDAFSEQVSPELMIEVISPYNTYLNLGLPPGPISNPGIAAIESVIKPAETDYIYFVASPACDGSHLFSASYSGHLRNVDKFKQSSCGALY